MSDFFLFFRFGRDLVFFLAPSELAGAGSGFSSGVGGGDRSGGKHEGMEESGEMEVMPAEGDLSLCREARGCGGW